jgi:hypothetical protein
VGEIAVAVKVVPVLQFTVCVNGDIEETGATVFW